MVWPGSVERNFTGTFLSVTLDVPIRILGPISQ